MSSAPRRVLSFSIVQRIAAARATGLAWLSKAVLAVLDQGLMAGSNFVLSIFLARWLTPEQYGEYALAFAIFLLVSHFYMSFLLEPMAVFGGSTYRSRMQGYLGSLLWLHLGATVVVWLLLGGIAWGAQLLGLGGDLPKALAAVMLAGPCIQLFWLIRRAFYTDLSPATAVVGAGFYSCIILGGLIPIYRYGLLSSFMAFLLMGFGALLTSALLLIRLKPTLRLKHLSPNLRETWAQHWDYGRWALATSVLLWIPSNFYYLFLAGYSGVASAGEFKVLINFVLPIENIAAALSLLFQSHVARVHYTQGASQVRKKGWQITMLHIVGASAYWGVLILSSEQVMRLLYGMRYANLRPLIPWLAIASIIRLSTEGPTIGLRAMESPASVFVVCAISSCITVLAGILLTIVFELYGTLWSMIFSNLIYSIIGFILLHRKAKKSAVTLGLH